MQATQMIHVHDRIILMRPAMPAGSASSLAPDERLVEAGRDDIAAIAAAYRQQGHRGDIARIARRFDHGLRFFAIAHGDAWIAWTWAVHGVPRYLDEFAWLIELGAGQAWGRDAYVVPEKRGKRLLSGLVEAASGLVEHPLQFFSDVHPANRASLAAHAAIGCVPVARVRALVLGKRLVLRPHPPAALPAVAALRPTQRLLWMSRAERDWHHAMIA